MGQPLRTALIDADTLVYSASLSAEVVVDWGDDLWTLHAYLNEATGKFMAMMAAIQEVVKQDKTIMALSDDNSAARWRNKVMSTYKQTRKKLRRPVVYAPIREWVAKTYETFLRPTLEGDDVLGILQTRGGSDETVIVSIDKDMKTIPGLHFNYGREGSEVVRVSEAEADYNHYQQTLTGDTTDNYPGCPKCGPVGAQKILDACWSGTAFHTDPWPAIVAAYKKQGLGEEVALMNARVARILRAEDYDFKKKEVILWNPS